MQPKRRYAFQCLNPECRRNQTRWIRRGRYVTCRQCGTRNPGPERLAEVFLLGRRPAIGDLVVPGARQQLAELEAARAARRSLELEDLPCSA